jgi:hypothetical protein
MISKPMVYLVQTVHLSCVEINTISKRTKTSLHLTQVTKEYHWVCPKWFPSRCTFGANRAPILHRDYQYLQADENELPLDPHHQGVPSGVPKMNSKPWYIRRKPCTCLAPSLTLSTNRPKQASTWHTLRWSTIGCAQSDFHARATFGANHASFLRRD